VLNLTYESERLHQDEEDESSDTNVDLNDFDPVMLFEQFFVEQNGVEMTDNQRSIMETALREALQQTAEGREVSSKGGNR